MKRIILLLFLVAVFCSVGFTEETENSGVVVSANFNYRIVSGGFWCCGQNFSGGFGEFGVNLLPQEKIFVLRDCIYVQGEGGTLSQKNGFDFGGLEIGNKLIIGGRVNCYGFVVRNYGFTSFSFGMFSCKNHVFTSQPFMLNLSFGGGFEFQFVRHSSFVVEFGGIKRFFAGEKNEDFQEFSKTEPVLTIGYRTFR
ncbi:MAG: hypothetical protein K6A15_01470 [Treponema sp.]|nr:hypothetical protein [Treponema sp.]